MILQGKISCLRFHKKWITNVKREQLWYGFLVGTMCCLLPFSFIKSGLLTDSFYIALSGTIVSGTLISIVCLKKDRAVSLTKNDIFVCLYILYGGLRAYFSREELPLSFFPSWVTLITVYIISRNMNHVLLPLFLWITCTLQAIIALLQFMGMVESGHPLFHVTGCFWNPSQLGGFIACFFPLFVNEWLTRRYPPGYWLGLLPLVCSLILSDSRAAWFACVMGVLYVLPFKFKGKLQAGLVTSGLVLVSVGLYFYRPVSALGRLYVWWICKEMVCAHPLWGSGIHSFSDEYMLYQANYFHAHPDSDFAGMAASVTTPYNEFIHVLVEQGGIGLLLFLLLLGGYFFSARSDYNKKYKGVVFSFMLFSSFSYPGENMALLFGLVACMGAIQTKEWYCICFSCVRRVMVVSMLVGAVCLNIKIIEKFYSLKIVMKQPLEQVSSRFKNEPDVLLYLLHTNKSLPISDRLVMLQWISKKKPEPKTYCELGNLYEQLQEYDKAEKYYQIAADMIPNQVRANYLLFKLYKTTGRTTEARQMAAFISLQHIKIENTFTLGVQGEVRRYLKDQDNLSK